MPKIADSNTKICLTIPRDLKSALQEIARRENRSFNNLIITVLLQYLDSRKE